MNMASAVSSPQMVSLHIDGRDVSVPQGATIWEAARQVGIDIPVLCHSPRLEPVGVCRMCVVDVGSRVLAAACVRSCEEGMTVSTSSLEIEKHRAMLTGLLLKNHPTPCAREQSTADCELEELGRRYGIISSTDDPTNIPNSPFRIPNSKSFSVQPTESVLPYHDTSSPVIAVDHAACILCDRCVRGCDDLQSNDVIGRTGKGFTARIGFDLNEPMGKSTCVACGECVSLCPTGALTNKPITLPIVPKEELTAVESVCPYCGVGCAITFFEKDNCIVLAEGRDSPVNHGRLCVKGRYGWDYTSHPQRLTKPLIRRDEFYPKGPLSPEVQSSLPDPGRKRKPGGIVDDADVLPAFREAEWDEVLELVG